MQDSLANQMIQQKMQEQLGNQNSNYNLNTRGYPMPQIQQAVAPPAPTYAIPGMDFNTAMQRFKQFKMSQGGGNPQVGERPTREIPQESSLNPGQNSAQELPPERGLWNNVGRHLLANIGGAGKNIMGSFDTGSFDMRLPKGVRPNIGDPYERLGIKKGFGDEIAEGALGFLPYGFGANAAVKAAGQLPKVGKAIEGFVRGNPIKTEMAKQAGAGAAYGAVNAPEGEKGNAALWGGSLGAGSVPLGMAAAAPLKYAAEKYAQSAIPGMTERATKYLKGLLSPDEYAGKIKSNYSIANAENKGKWDEVDSIAKKLDESLLAKSNAEKNTNIKFNNSPYVNHIDKFLKEVGKLEPAKKSEYKQAIDFAERAKQLAPESFSGAVSARKNINQELKDFLKEKNIAAESRQAKEFIKGLKKVLSNDLIDENTKIFKKGVGENFRGIWDSANKSNVGLQEYYKGPQGLGRIAPIRQIREAVQDTGTADGGLIGKYMPKPSQTGTSGIEQLSKSIGSKEEAQSAAKSYLNRKSLDNGIRTVDASGEYAKLGPVQRKEIYGGSKEGELLETINDVRTKFGREPGKTLDKANALKTALPYLGAAAVGGGASHYSGADPEVSLALAGLSMLGLKGAGLSAGKLSPKTIRWLADYASSKTKNPGRYINPALQSYGNSIRNSQQEGNQ